MKYLYIVLATIALLSGVFYAGNQYGRAAMQVKIAEANKKYQDLHNSQQEKVDEIIQNYTDRLAGVNSQLDDALKRLRNRPDRLPETSQANCTGATGAQLSAPDAEFLTREAARADRIREALTACYKYADELQTGD